MKKVPTEGVPAKGIPVPNPLDEKRWGKAVVLQKGDQLAGTKLAAARLFYPAFTELDGTPLSVAAATEIVQRLLQQAHCHTDRTQVLRHTAASIALNEWGVSVKDVCQIFHWQTEQLVWSRYARQQEEAVFAKFDARTEAAFALPSDAARIVRETAAALATFLGDAARSENDQLIPVWTALTRALEVLTQLDPDYPRLADATLMPSDLRAVVDEFIRQKADRHSNLESVAGRRLPVGLPVPRPGRPDPADDEDDEQDEAGGDGAAGAVA